jgi:hypothetical protein
MTEAVGRVVSQYVDVEVPPIGHFSAAEPYVVAAHLAVTYRIG